MAHKYDHRFTAGGCAYWKRCMTSYRRMGNKSLRHRITQAVQTANEAIIDKEVDDCRSRAGYISWDIYD